MSRFQFPCHKSGLSSARRRTSKQCQLVARKHTYRTGAKQQTRNACSLLEYLVWPKMFLSWADHL
eukprot:1051294-Alexandrium_andersonii.AAC.1